MKNTPNEHGEAVPLAKYRTRYGERLTAASLWEDDFFAAACAEKKVIAEFIKPVMHRPDLTVTWVRPQSYQPNLKGHSVRLDVIAADGDGRLYNIEVQQVRTPGLIERLRLYSATLESEAYKRGKDGYKRAAETAVIVYCRFDYFGEGRECYPVGRCRLDTGDRFADRSTVYLINGTIASDSPLGLVVHDMGCTDYTQMHNRELAERVRFLKTYPEGVKMAYEYMDSFSNSIFNDGLKIGIEQGVETVAVNMMAEGMPLDQVAHYSGLPLAELEKLKGRNSACQPQR